MKTSELHIGTALWVLAYDQRQWSEATFGSDDERGPVGALRHLRREAKEAIDNPHDAEEYADCFLLIVDAARRAGFSIGELLHAAQLKLEINKGREWPEPGEDGQPVEHVVDSEVTMIVRRSPLAPVEGLDRPDTIWLGEVRDGENVTTGVTFPDCVIEACGFNPDDLADGDRLRIRIDHIAGEGEASE